MFEPLSYLFYVFSLPTLRQNFKPITNVNHLEVINEEPNSDKMPSSVIVPTTFRLFVLFIYYFEIDSSKCITHVCGYFVISCSLVI